MSLDNLGAAYTSFGTLSDGAVPVVGLAIMADALLSGVDGAVLEAMAFGTERTCPACLFRRWVGVMSAPRPRKDCSLASRRDLSKTSFPEVILVRVPRLKVSRELLPVLDTVVATRGLLEV